MCADGNVKGSNNVIGVVVAIKVGVFILVYSEEIFVHSCLEVETFSLMLGMYVQFDKLFVLMYPHCD